MPNPPKPIDPNDPPAIPIDPVPAIEGKHQCGISCLAMLSNYWIKKDSANPSLYSSTNLSTVYATYDTNYITNVKPRTPLSSRFESSAEWLAKPTGQSTSIIEGMFQSKGLNKNNYNFKRTTNNTGNDLYDIISDSVNGFPVIVPTKLTGVGHFVIIVGYDPNVDSYIVNDPFFTFNFIKKKYERPQGQKALYPRQQLLNYLVQASQSNGQSGILMIYVEKK